MTVRVASLLPSATEIVYALGVDDVLVAVTFECDEPERARQDKAVVVSGADTSRMTPGEIDAYVREQRAAGEDLYTLDENALGPLAPTVVLTQDLCRVCALPTERIDVALAHLGCSADVVTLDPHRLRDVFDDIRSVARACRVPERGDELVRALELRLDRVRQSVAGRTRPRVAVVEWVDPLFQGGHWIPDLVAAAGGLSVGGHPGAASGATSWAGLRDLAPDVVFVAPCGYGLVAAAQQARVVLEQVPDAQVWALDGDGVVVRPGPRLVDGVEAMAAALHPDALPPSAHVRRVQAD